MEFSTSLIWLIGIHALLAFFVSLSVLTCPFRFGFEKFGLFLITWLVPFFGSIFVQHRIGSIPIKSAGSTGSSTFVDIPPSSGDNSGGGSSDSGGGSD